ETHQLYRQKLEEVTKLQESCSVAIARQRKRLKDMSHSLKICMKNITSEEAGAIKEIQELIKERPNIFFEMEAFLPKKNGLYLRLVLGNVNVTLLSKQAKFAYKDEYEKFKLYLTVILLFFSFMCQFLVRNRIVDVLFNFLLVWYYATLTIRESILIRNGSRPNGKLYQMFRNQFLAYSLYQSFVHLLQYYYQSGCLYRLRALGERHNMDLTVIVCGSSFMVLFLGNFFTTLSVVFHKFKNKNQGKYKRP
ncbi:hypothetical protein JZ751_002089, partial [Albula glossodonta]